MNSLARWTPGFSRSSFDKLRTNGKILIRRNRKIICNPILSLLLWFGWLSIAAADAPLSAQAIALNCQTCHQQAVGDNAIPDLGKLSRQQMRQTLLDFKHGDKPATIMPRLAKGYTDDELLAVADYLTPQ